jgi:hypothetical protein
MALVYISDRDLIKLSEKLKELSTSADVKSFIKELVRAIAEGEIDENCYLDVVRKISAVSSL